MNRIRTWLRRQPEPPTFTTTVVPVYGNGMGQQYAHGLTCDRCGCFVMATVTHKRRGC